jgi:voltage-gated potassium channel Kch
MKLLRISVVSGIINRYFGDLARFFENTRIDNIFLGVIIIVIIFTFAIYALDPGLNLFDSLWYVVVTLTTVGYGDVTPNTFSAKVISLMLLIIGIFVFSTLTGAISSFFTDKILDIDSDVEENLDVLNRKIDNLDSEIKTVRKELELSRAENKKLQDKIDELLKK